MESLELEINEMTTKLTETESTLKIGQAIFMEHQQELHRQILQNQDLEERLRGKIPEPSTIPTASSSSNKSKRRETNHSRSKENTEKPRKKSRLSDTTAPGGSTERTPRNAEPTIADLLDDSFASSSEEIRNLLGPEPEVQEETTPEEELAVEKVVAIIKPKARMVPRTLSDCTTQPSSS